MKIRYCDYYHPSSNDPAFYTWDSPEWIATVEFEDRLLEAWVVGEMRIQFPNEDIVRYSDELSWAGIANDSDIETIKPEYWINNSWIELRTYEGEWLEGVVFHSVKEAVEGMQALLADEEFLMENPCKNPDYVVGSAHNQREEN
jgi:hypothetical protein